MARSWYKLIPPKVLSNEFGIYGGMWMPHMDRYWESSDGYSVMSRQIRTDWGTVEHITVQRLGGKGDIPWAEKQAIKDELFGDRRTAIEVFPAKKHLVDVCDVYHLWLLPKDLRLPFGIHPTRDAQGVCLPRGMDFNVNDPKVLEWMDSPKRKAIIEHNR